MVALKYALLPDEEREYIFMAEYSIAEAMNEKNQLLSGWMPLLDEVLDEEVHIASLVTGVDLCEGSFSHEVRMGDPLEAAQRWQNLLLLEDNVQELETLSVSNETMLKRLLRKSVSTDTASHRSRMVLTVGIAMVVAIIPCVFRAAKAYSVTGSTAFSVIVAAFGASSWMVCSVTVISMLVVFMTCFVALLFLIAGVVHYRRKHLALHWFALMIRPLLHAHSWLPKLQLEGTFTECNVVGLVHCVSVISVLGGKYQKRLEAYALAILGVSLVGLGHIFLRVALSGDTSSTEDDTVQMSAFDCQVLFCIVVNCTLIFYMISYGAKANDSIAHISARLVDAQWRLQLTCHGDRKASTQCQEMIAAAVERLDRHPQTFPVTIGGTMATVEKGYSLISTVSTVAIFVVAKMLHLST